MTIKYIDRQTGKVNTETPPGEGFLKFLYQNPLGKLALHGFVKRKFLSSYYGKLMDKPKSKKRILPFIKQLNIDMSEAEKTVNDFISFNDFFYRKLKPTARPIGDGLIAPGDGKLLAFKTVSEVNTFFVKGEKFTLKKYLQNNQLTKQFNNAALLILRLAPNDYHRFHFPYNGTALASQKIKGDYFSVSPYALTENFTRVFCENKREYTILKTPNKGDILLSPVGATMVGSIINTYNPETTLHKGDEMGYFAFGGSTVVMLINTTHFNINSDLIENTKKGMETFVKMGETIAL